MAELTELVQSLPLPALGVLAAVLAQIIGFRYLGILQGPKASPPRSESTVYVAAVIVDPTALTAAAAEVTGLAIAITEVNVMGRAHTAPRTALGRRLISSRPAPTVCAWRSSDRQRS